MKAGCWSNLSYICLCGADSQQLHIKSIRGSVYSVLLGVAICSGHKISLVNLFKGE